jgi:hypothetical protein
MDTHTIAKSTHVSLSMIHGFPKNLSTSLAVIMASFEAFGDGIDTMFTLYVGAGTIKIGTQKHGMSTPTGSC